MYVFICLWNLWYTTTEKFFFFCKDLLNWWKVTVKTFVMFILLYLFLYIFFKFWTSYSSKNPGEREKRITVSTKQFESLFNIDNNENHF